MLHIFRCGRVARRAPTAHSSAAGPGLGIARVSRDHDAVVPLGARELAALLCKRPKKERRVCPLVDEPATDDVPVGDPHDAWCSASDDEWSEQRRYMGLEILAKVDAIGVATETTNEEVMLPAAVVA